MKRETVVVGERAVAGERASRFTASRVAFGYCGVALVLFAFLAYAAVRTKSATVDEPVHAVSAYAVLRHGDFRPEPDHPPLWKYVAALPWLAGPEVHDHLDKPAVRTALDSLKPLWAWSVITLYRTPGNEADRLLAESRLMMLLVGVGLGVVTARFAWRVAGPVAACVAVTLFALDPNFLGHAPLVKNDVAIALCTTGLAYALYLAGESLTWVRAAAVALLCAACVTTKLTGLLAAPIVVVAFAVRALMPAPWRVFGRMLSTRARRLLAAVGVYVACAVVTYVGIWGVYRFRFDPTSDPALHIDRSELRAELALFDARARTGDPEPSAAEVGAYVPAAPVRAVFFSLDHRLLPEAFLDGLLHTYANSRYRVTYLLGRVHTSGQWAYFPVAVLVKTPLGTLAALLVAVIFGIRRRSRSGGVSPPAVPVGPVGPAWLWTCLALSAGFVFVSAVASNMNIGLRHVFPVYPLVFVAASVSLAGLYRRRPGLAKPVLGVLLLALASESFLAFPDYISFFNAAAGGERGGYFLLSDSNLDWGQDLPLLAAWQERHPDRPLYLAYFGSADPAHYGIRYHNLPGGFALGPPAEPLPRSNAVVAVSAMILQDVWLYPRLTATYAPLRNRQPTEVLGGSIYLFDLGGQ